MFCRREKLARERLFDKSRSVVLSGREVRSFLHSVPRLVAAADGCWRLEACGAKTLAELQAFADACVAAVLEMGTGVSLKALSGPCPQATAEHTGLAWVEELKVNGRHRMRILLRAAAPPTERAAIRVPVEGDGFYLPALRALKLSDFSMTAEISAFLACLKTRGPERLCLSRCRGMKDLDMLSRINLLTPRLRELRITDCPSLASLHALQSVAENLDVLSLRRCRSLASLLWLSRHATGLMELDIRSTAVDPDEATENERAWLRRLHTLDGRSRGVSSGRATT